MALIAFEDWIAQPEHNKVFIADTNFILKSNTNFKSPEDSYWEEDCALLKQARAKILACENKIIYNATVKHELLRRIRTIMANVAIQELHIDGKTFGDSFKQLLVEYPVGNGNGSDKCFKQIVRKGYNAFFTDLLGEDGEHLNAEFEAMTTGCHYYPFKGSLSWGAAKKTMAQYGLDSADAMIVNAGVNVSDCVGLLTADADFRFCYDVNNFDIIMPRRLIRNMRKKKPITYSIY